MPDCNAILRQGVFDTITINESRSADEFLFEWLKSATYAEFKQKQDAGLNVGLPLAGVPFSLKGDYTEDEFNLWKQQVDQGQVRSFSQSEMMQIVQRSASKTIADTWLACVIGPLPPSGTGLFTDLEATPRDPFTLVYTARFLPTSIDDLPAKVEQNGFQVVGADVSAGLATDQEIPFGGVKLLMRRQGNSAVTVVLTTDKGSSQASVPAIPTPPPPPDPAEMNIGITIGQKPGHYPLDGRYFYLLYTMNITGPQEGFKLIRGVRYTVFYQFSRLGGPAISKSDYDERTKPVPKSYEFSSTDVNSRFSYTLELLEYVKGPAFGWPFLHELFERRTVTGIQARAEFLTGQTYDYIWSP